MSLTPGSKLGPYEVLASIGAGGMGEVYRARDPRVGRDVAIKVSAERFSERFEREARAIASLNHVNICTLYDVGPNYLVMELVEGPTLAERIKQGAIPLEEARAIAKQIAAALEAAHDKDVVHRDLKPGNVKIKPDGTVKVLDFGLAKLGGTPAAPSQDSPTLSMAATQAGVILGTLAYMAPEQAKGKPVDQRADIWAFGVVLFEMVTGKPLFHGESTTEILASVIKEEPQWERAPVEVRRLLRRCLEKDPQKRLRHIGDAMALWDEAHVGQVSDLPAPVQAKGLLYKVVAGVLGLSTAGLAYLYLRPTPAPPAEAVRFEIVQPASLAFSDSLATSPDGRKLAFIATSTGAGRQDQVFVRSLDAVEARPLAGTEGAAGVPFWSPDSRYIVFWAGGKLQKMEASGSPAQTLCSLGISIWGGFWTRDNRIVFGSNTAIGLSVVNAAGGAASPLTSLANGEQRHGYPALLPDGRHFVYLRAVTTTNGGIYLGSLDAKPDEPASKRLLPDVSAVAYVPSADSSVRTPKGYLLFVRGGTLMAQPFDNQKLEMSGEAVPIAERIGLTGFSASDTGVLSYRNGVALPGQQFTWFDREGKITGMVGEPALLAGLNSAPALSPDEKRAAFAATDPQSGNTDIWLYDFARGTTTRFTFDPGQDVTPVWSPDGSSIAFAGQRGGVWGIYQKASNLTGGENLLYKAGAVTWFPTSWSHDGKFLLYMTGGAGVLALPLTGATAGGSGDAKPIALLPAEFGQRGARFSPDGRFFSYISNENGKDEIYVQSFDPSLGSGAGGSGAKSGGGKWMVSKGGGLSAHWRGDGKEIFYLAPNGDLMSVEVSTAPVFQAGVPKRLFNPKAASRFWDVTSNGQRFVIPVPVGQNSAAPYTVVLNWQAGLKR